MVIVFLLAVLLILVVAGRWYAAKWDENLEAEVRFGQPFAYEGDTALLVETIENRKKLPVPVLEIGFQIEKGIRYLDTENTQVSDYNYKRDIFSIRGMEEITRKYRILCGKRGRYHVTGLYLEAEDLLFQRRMIREEQQNRGTASRGRKAEISSGNSSASGESWKRAESEESNGTGPEFVVYCQRIDCSTVLHAVEVILGQRESSRRIYEDPFAFSSIREYTIRDPMKTINWKASARTGGLMVNTFTSVLSDHVLIFMDASMGGQRYGESLLEGTLSLTATLCQRLLEQHQTVGLVTSRTREGSPVIFPPGTGAGKLAQIEYFLSGSFRDDNTELLGNLLRDHRIRNVQELSGTEEPVCIFISANDSPQLREEIRQYLQTGGTSGSVKDAILVVPLGSGMEAAPGNAGGIHVLPVRI